MNISPDSRFARLYMARRVKVKQTSLTLGSKNTIENRVMDEKGQLIVTVKNETNYRRGWFSSGSPHYDSTCIENSDDSDDSDDSYDSDQTPYQVTLNRPFSWTPSWFPVGSKRVEVCTRQGGYKRILGFVVKKKTIFSTHFVLENEFRESILHFTGPFWTTRCGDSIKFQDEHYSKLISKIEFSPGKDVVSRVTRRKVPRDSGSSNDAPFRCCVEFGPELDVDNKLLFLGALFFIDSAIHKRRVKSVK